MYYPFPPITGTTRWAAWLRSGGKGFLVFG